MDISFTAFRKLYQLLMNKIYDEELLDDQKKGRNPLDYSIWDIEAPGKDKQNFFDKIFKGSIARNQLYKKYGEYDPSKALIGTIKEHTANSIFEYLGFKLTNSEIIVAGDDAKAKAQLLYDKFINQVVNNRSPTSDAAKFDLKSATLEEFIKYSEKRNAIDVFIRREKFQTSFEEVSFNEALVIRMMLEYIDTIASGNFSEGYEYWDRDVRWEKWYGNRMEFASEYFLTERIYSKSKGVFNVHVASDHYNKEVSKIHKASCYMYYQASVLAIIDNDLKVLENLPFSHHEIFSKKLNEFLNRCLNADFEDFQNLKITTLLSDNLLSKLKIDNGRDLKDLRALFPKIERKLINCLYKVHLKAYYNDTSYRWGIEKIVPASLDKVTTYY